MNKKRWLILSHAFNMDGRAASQTITDKMPYFLEAGIKPIVYSAITGIKDHRFPHRQFLAWGPAAFRFDFRHWVANQYGRRLLYKVVTPLVSVLLSPFIAIEKALLGYSSQWSWAMPAFVHGIKAIRSHQIDLVYSSGGAWSAHLAALWLKKTTGVYWIAEIHDPLVIRRGPEDQGLDRPVNRDARFRQWLERQICQFADVAWWFTDGAVHYAKVRNPALNTDGHARGVMVLPGAEPPGAVTAEVKKHAYGDHFVISHFGSLANDRSISTILNALPSFFERFPQARAVLQVHVYGAKVDTLTAEAIERYGFDDLVIAHGRLEKDPITGKSGRERIAERMQAADVLLLLHGEDEWCAEYIPSKMYEYFWMGRPIWAITHRNPQMDHLLEERNAYVCAAGNPLELNTMLERIWIDWEHRRLQALRWDPIGVDHAAKQIVSLIH